MTALVIAVFLVGAVFGCGIGWDLRGWAENRAYARSLVTSAEELAERRPCA